MGSSMAWVGESVTNSLSRPHHHKERIPKWAQESPLSPYSRTGTLVETFLTRAMWKVPEDLREVYTIVEDAGSVHTSVEECGRM